MIRKIKTGIDNNLSTNSDVNEQKNKGSLNFSSESSNNTVESFDLSSFSNNSTSQSNTVTDQMALDAISQNLNNNRMMTNNMEQQIYNSFMDKINKYVSNGMGNIK